MRFNITVKINNGIEQSIAKERVMNLANKERVLKLKKGIRLINGNVSTGLDGIDFMYDRYTALIRFDSYKVPRIISRYFLNK